LVTLDIKYAGTPPTLVKGATGLVTTAPEFIIAPSPILIFPNKG
jgi:hypothetical protein